MTLKRKPAVKRRSKPKKTAPTTEDFIFTDGLHGLSEYQDYRDGMVLVPIGHEPDHAAFPKVNELGVPPDTYYAFNPDTNRVEFMVSHDPGGDGVMLAWDCDRDGRYFTRVPRPLMCPRSVEYAYDTSVALLAGEHWSHSHRNYRGSLSGQIVAAPYTDTPKTRKTARAGTSAAKTGGLTRKGATSTKPKPGLRAKRPLRKEADSDMLSARGLDRSRLQSHAEKLESEYDDVFGGGAHTPKKRATPLRKKRR